MRIGFSTQNFLKAMPFSTESLLELIRYASREGYRFIELRDNQAERSTGECRVLAAAAETAGIEIIYEIQVNLLHPGFGDIFEKALDNTVIFSEPGILRVTLSGSEFAVADAGTGWSKEQLDRACSIAEGSALVAEGKGVRLIVENLTEPFFGDPPDYYGLDDFFGNTRKVGMQFDLCNPFVSVSRKKAEPEKVASFLSTLGDRWVTTHIKTSIKGVPRPIVGESPLSVRKVTGLMGEAGVKYFALEMVAAEEREDAFSNHESSLVYLEEQAIIRRE